MSELWTVALFFRGHGRQVNLMFNGEAAARKVFDEYARQDRIGWLSADHYGSRLVVYDEGPLEALMLQDNTKGFEAQVELSLIQARAQAKANTRASHDAQLKFVSGSALNPGAMGLPRG